MPDDRRKTEIADIDEDPNVEIRPFSSPPCYAHEVDPAYFGLTSSNETLPIERLVRNRRVVEEAVDILAALLSRR